MKFSTAISREKDIIIDVNEQKKKEKELSDKRYEERKQAVKNFFGFGSSNPIKNSNEPVKKMKAKESKFKIFGDESEERIGRVNQIQKKTVKKQPQVIQNNSNNEDDGSIFHKIKGWFGKSINDGNSQTQNVQKEVVN